MSILSIKTLAKMLKPVALILLNWNTYEHTSNCIYSLKKYCNALLFDIVIADNGSTDNSLVLLQQQFPDAIFINNQKNIGFAEGNNKALIYSIEKGYLYSLLINTDTVVDEDIVDQLTRHLNDHPKAAAVQPAIYWMHAPAKLWNGRGDFNKTLGSISSNRKISVLKTNISFETAKWVTGCCMLVRNSALIESGLFNKLFFLYYEDVELSFRLRAAGHELHYLPNCKMYHEAGASANLTVKRKEGFLRPIIHYYISRNRIWVLRKYGSRMFYPLYFLNSGIYFSLLLLYFVVRLRKEKAIYLLKGLKDGLFTANSQIWVADNLI